MKKIIHVPTHFVKYQIALLLSVAALSGCGEQNDPKVSAYRSDLEDISQRIETLSTQINTIDANAEDAEEQFLSSLEEMNGCFRDLAALETPSSYPEAATMATEAETLMNDAVTLYQTAYAGDGYDTTAATQAKSQYENAMKRINSLGSYLMGSEGD